MGNPCPYCLACALVAKDSGGMQTYWLGAKIGTAIHALLEHEELKHVITPQSKQFKSLRGALVEQSIKLGEIKGYGEIWSKPDLFLVNDKHLIDHKTSKRAKSDQYVLKNTVPEQYVAQGMLYARGLEDAGYEVEQISFVFINRDGTSDRDVRVISYPYDRTVADAVWDRVVAAWEWIERGNDIESLPSAPGCYRCEQILGRY